MMLKKASSLLKQYGEVTEQCRVDFKTWINKRTELSGMEQAYSEIDDDGQVIQLSIWVPGIVGQIQSILDP